MKGERLVGELRCSEVLALLPDYVGGNIAPADLARLQAHVGGCPLCERFGGQYAAAVQQLRASLAPSPSTGEQDTMRRLQQRLLDLPD
jgi:anti-sigma factor RsiW